MHIHDDVLFYSNCGRSSFMTVWLATQRADRTREIIAGRSFSTLNAPALLFGGR